MLPETGMIPVVRELEPVQQGDFDNLCGLCSIVNAIHVATAQAGTKLDRGDLRGLFRYGVKLLARDRRLTTVLDAGIGEQAWMRLCSRMLDFAGEATGVALARHFIVPSSAKRLDTGRALRTIRRELADGRPVLAVLWGALNHCTVIVGYTATRFQLFDSSGHRWISVALTGLQHDRSIKRHQISPASAIALHAQAEAPVSR